MFESSEGNDKLSTTIPTMEYQHFDHKPDSQDSSAIPAMEVFHQDHKHEELKSKSNSSTKKRSRTAYTSYQLIALERAFLKNNYISRPSRTYMAKELGLFEKQIKIWFQNRRMKDKTGKPKTTPGATAATPSKDKRSILASQSRMEKDYDQCIVSRLLSQRKNVAQSQQSNATIANFNVNQIPVPQHYQNSVRLPTTLLDYKQAAMVVPEQKQISPAKVEAPRVPPPTAAYYQDYHQTHNPGMQFSGSSSSSNSYYYTDYNYEPSASYGFNPHLQTSSTSPISDSFSEEVVFSAEKMPQTTISWGAYPVLDSQCILNL